MESSPFETDVTSHQPSKTQSLFKLPAIFALLIVMGAIFILTILYLNQLNIDLNRDYLNILFFNFLNYGIINQLFIYLPLYFCIGLIMFISQKIHEITLKNIMLILLMCIIFVFVRFLISRGSHLIIQLLTVHFSLETYQRAALYLPMNIIVFIINVLILLFIIKLVGLIGKKQRSSYSMPLGNHQTLFAALFSVMFYLPLVVVLFSICPLIINGYSMMFSNGSGVFTFMTIIIIFYIILLLSLTINWLVIFFSISNCFTKKFSYIPLKLLFKTVGWSYLYLLIFNVVTGFIYSFLLFLINTNNNSYYRSYDALFSMFLWGALVLILFSLTSFIAAIFFTRKSIKKYFYDAQNYMSN